MDKKIKKQLKKYNIFVPDEWLRDLDNIDFDEDWLKKTSAKKPEVKKNILKTIIGSVVMLGVLNRRDTKQQVNKVLDTYAKRAKLISNKEKMGQEALRTLSQLGEKDLKRIVENELVYSAGAVSKEAHRNDWFEWLPTQSAKPDPYHQALTGGIYPPDFVDANGNDLGENRRYGCKCGMRFCKPDGSDL